MKSKIFALLALGMLVGPLAANATSILGSWSGAWSSGPYAADFNLTFDSQNSAGQFTGYFDWFCTAGLTCSGREFIGGTQTGSSLAFATTSIQAGAVNLAFSSYSGTVGTGLMSFTDNGGGSSRATQVPEPGSLALLGLGLLGLAVTRRKAL